MADGYIIRGKTRRTILMIAVIQRVERASVSVEKQEISAIGQGLLVLLGVAEGDTESEAEYLASKILELRIFNDDNGKMNLSVMDTGGEIIVVSQFTLLADCRKGRRPNYIQAAQPQHAKTLYEYFIQYAGRKYGKVKGGVFGAMMKVELVNDGPVTIIVESRQRCTGAG